MRIRHRSQRLTDLVTTLEDLHPGSLVDIRLASSTGAAFRLVPGPRHPRIVVPAKSRRAASGAVDRPSINDSLWRTTSRRLLSAALSTGFGSALMPYGLSVSPSPDSISDYLSEAVGEPVLISLTVGAARANRKPILNVHRSDGTEIGFAKVGLTPLSNRLVAHEHRALQALAAAAPDGFTAPTPLHHGVWRGNQVLLMSALRSDTQQVNGQLPVAAAAQIAGTTPIRVVPIESSGWIAELYRSVEQFRSTPDNRLALSLDQFARSYRDLELPFGAWHGDFGPWNLALTSAAPMIWDWERYDLEMPVGSDVVHYVSHPALRRQGDLGAARKVLEDSCRPALRQVLRAANLPDSANNPLVLDATVIAYLLTIAVRFTADSLTPQGQPVQSLARWHQQVISDQLERATARILERP